MPLGEYTLTREIQIDRPIEAVFDFVADPENDPKWCRLVPDAAFKGDPETGLGPFEFVQIYGRSTLPGKGEIVSITRPTGLRSTLSVMGGEFTSTYQLESMTGATMFRHTSHVRWGGARRILHPILKRITSRTMERQLADLKSQLESTA